MLRRMELIALTLLTLLALGGGPAMTEPLQVRVSWTAPVSDWASIWLEKKDLARNYGKTYVFDAVHYRGTPPMITAFGANELDIGSLAYSTLPIAVENAGMDDMRVISENFEDGYPGYYSNEYEVLADGPIRRVEDLKGKVVATNAAGSAVDVAMRAFLHQHGLEANRDYTIIEAPFPAMRAMLAEKKADLIPAVPPFSFDPELKKIGRTLFTSKDGLGLSQFIMWTARKPFIDAHRAVLVDLLEDSLRIIRWYLDPQNHDAVEQIAAHVTKKPASQFGWVFTKSDYYRNPQMLPNLDALQNNVDLVQKLGLVHARLDVKAHADLSMIEEAAKRLQ
ncbi:MAG TPA: ABC transporter substrate-binding protein [Xanthobacteraceae bacterium]